MIPILVDNIKHCNHCDEPLSDFDDVCRCGAVIDWSSFYAIQEDEDE